MTDNWTNAPILVDATLRDGGYANNYGFTCTEVQRVAAGLRDAGVSMIEIGHGFGLGADRSFGKMVETDAAYICCLAGGLDGALSGMFANANISTKPDVVEAARLGLQFLRVGCIGFTEPHPFSVALELGLAGRFLSKPAMTFGQETQSKRWIWLTPPVSFTRTT